MKPRPGRVASPLQARSGPGWDPVPSPGFEELGHSPVPPPPLTDTEEGSPPWDGPPFLGTGSWGPGTRRGCGGSRAGWGLPPSQWGMEWEGQSQGPCLSSDTGPPSPRGLPAALCPQVSPPTLATVPPEGKGAGWGDRGGHPGQPPEFRSPPRVPDSTLSPGGQRGASPSPSARSEGWQQGGKQSGGIPETPETAALFRSLGRGGQGTLQAPPACSGSRGLMGHPSHGSPGPRTHPESRPTSRAQCWLAPGLPPGGRSLAGPSGNPGTSRAPSRAGHPEPPSAPRAPR